VAGGESLKLLLDILMGRSPKPDPISFFRVALEAAIEVAELVAGEGPFVPVRERSAAPPLSVTEVDAIVNAPKSAGRSALPWKKVLDMILRFLPLILADEAPIGPKRI
jgi:hypothetical protein